MEEVKRVTKKPTKLEEMSKEQIRKAIVKKRECNVKALKIVEELLESGIPDDVFLQHLPHINQSHLEDVIEERSIVHLCGYPPCTNSISNRDMPKQKYRISLKTNKVYDITTRKNFCSNSCYKSAMYIKAQMLTSPLWFREYEEMPSFQLLPLDTVGSLGQEVDLGQVPMLTMQTQTFSSVNDFTSASLSEMTPNDGNADSVKSKLHEDETSTEKSQRHENNKPQKPSDSDGNTTETIPCPPSPYEENLEKKRKISQKNKATGNPLNIVGEIIEKPERKVDPILVIKPPSSYSPSPIVVNKNVVQTMKSSLSVFTIEVEKCLAQWFTLDTILFLFGEAKVKEMVADKGDCIKEYLNNYSKQIFYTSNAYDQYQALCRKLNMLELEDRKLDTAALQKESKPLPDYSILQQESQRLQVKVNAFLAGETNVPDIDLSSTRNPVDSENSQLTQLPLVDKNAQNAVRRRIVYQHLTKVLPDLLQSLGFGPLSINSQVRLLLNTFKLKPNNIMFKPIQWTLIAIIVLKLLSLRDPTLHHQLEQPVADRHMQLLLLSYKQDGGYLDRLLIWLTDIDRLLDSNDTHLTVE